MSQNSNLSLTLYGSMVHLDESVRCAIMAYHMLEWSVRMIAKQLSLSKSTVAYHVKSFKDRGTMARKEGSGRKRKTTAEDDRYIIQAVKRKRTITAHDIKTTMGFQHISVRTITRRIGECSDFGSYWATKKPLISIMNRRKRLQWAIEHRNWTVEQWRRVIWSDESPFVLTFNQRTRVWRMHNERYRIECCVPTVKHDYKLNVWGAFSAHGVGRFYRVQGILKKEQYLEMLEHQLLPSAEQLFPDGNYLFQQDNDPKHTAKVCKAFVQDRGIPTMAWPSQSPDLNPIENLWSIMDRQLKNRQPRTLDQLFTVLTQCWNNLDTDLLRRLVDSMPRRCQAVIDARGFPTKY